MATTVHAFEWIESAKGAQLPPMVVLVGSDGFLLRHAIAKVIEASQTDPDAIEAFDGPESNWRDVHDELATISLFDASHHRVAIVKDADKFVSSNRASLEKWIEHPPKDAVLVLEVSTFPGTTKLYKQVVAKGLLIQCNPPVLSSWGNPVDEKAIAKWLGSWAKQTHRLELTQKQMHTLLDRIGTDLGMLDCELAKLALFADAQGNVPDQRVNEMVGGWRTQTLWEIADHVADGKIGHALEQLDRLLSSGQNALAFFAPLAWSLRRYGVAAQLVEQSERCGAKPNLPFALERAGFKKFDLKKAEGQLRRIGRPRAKQLLNWLVEMEMKLKGTHSNDRAARFAIEEFLVKLA